MIISPRLQQPNGVEAKNNHLEEVGQVLVGIMIRRLTRVVTLSTDLK